MVGPLLMIRFMHALCGSVSRAQTPYGHTVYMPLYIPDSCIDCLCVSKVCGSSMYFGGRRFKSHPRQFQCFFFNIVYFRHIALHYCLYNISFIIIIALKDLSFIIKLNCNGKMIVVSLNF